MGCGIDLYFMLMSLTNHRADFVSSPFLLANVLLKKNVFTHYMSSCSYWCWIKEFLYNQRFIWAFQQQQLTLGKEYFGSFICVNAFLL